MATPESIQINENYAGLDTKQALEFIGKVFIFSTGMLYILGLIVVNIHLGQYGTYALNLLQLNYVIAGMWTLLPVLVAIGAVAFVIFNLQAEIERNSKKGKIKFFAIFSALISSLVAFYVGISGLAKYLGFNFRWSWLWVVLLGAFLGFVLVAVVFDIFSNNPLISIKALSRSVVGVSFAICLSIFYVAVFARTVYREIPAGLGGGRLRQVSFLVDMDSKPYFQALGFQFNDDSRVISVELVSSTDAEYVFIAKPLGRVVSVSRQPIKAVIYESP